MAISRRKFLRDASVGAAAVGTAAAWAPGLVGLAASDGPEVSSDVSSSASSVASSVASVNPLGPVEGPVVAHVVDAANGTVAVYHGTQEVIVHSPGLVSALHAALH
ncbi:MAG TPA: twin-arginine translocation signal domain-containing protein [Acidimicrobiales bacterium]|nr:twin-arginine translocation signal domain-containing protein [Acidimicrobiales bacterium]